MALSVNYCYEFALKLIKKNQSGGLASNEFEYHWNDAQNTYQDDLLGRFQARNNGKEGVNTGLIEDETILQKLAPFTKPVDLTITNGLADKPSDFVYRLALRVYGYDAYKLNHNQVAYATHSVIDPPSSPENTYYFVEYEDYYSFLPNTAVVAKLDYICTPPDVKWGFTYDANNRKVYNPGTSIQPLWDSNSTREITKRMLTNIGVAFKDNDFANFGKSVQLTGE